MQKLKFFVHNDPDAVRIELAGCLCGVDVKSVHQAWQRALTESAKRLIVDLRFVTDADEFGRALLVIMQQFGAQIVAPPSQSG
jgi:anti-anti-sigma regulatory factor